MSYEIPFGGPRTPSPVLVAAWLVNGRIPIERVPWSAAEMLASGHDGLVLRELAGLGANDPHAIRDLLTDALAEQGIGLPANDLADAIMIFDQLARRTLAGEVGPRWVAQTVVDVIDSGRSRDALLKLPLGELYVHADWVWNPEPTPAGLAATVRELCLRQVELSRLPSGGR